MLLPRMLDYGLPLLFLLPQLRVKADRFLGANEAVTIGVDAVEVGACAQEIAERHVANAVAVHLAEPQRTNHRRGGRCHAPNTTWRRQDKTAAWQTNRRGNVKLPRDLLGGDDAIAV